MHAWEQLQITLDYIDTHLEEKLKIEELAQMAALSPFYYQRLFKRLVKKPVMEYIKLRRMAKATEALLQQDKRILDIAMELGFASHEQFTKNFKDTFGLTPEAYRKAPVALNHMTKPQLLLNYTIIDQNVPLIADGIVLEISQKEIHHPRYYIGISTQAPVQLVEGLGTESGEDPLYSPWETFHNQKKDIPGLVQDAEEIGVAYPSQTPGSFCYFSGARAKSPDQPADYTSWTIEPGTYLVCTFEAESFEALIMDALYKAQQYLFNVWLKSHNLTTEPWSIEYYPQNTDEVTTMEVWVKPIEEK